MKTPVEILAYTGEAGIVKTRRKIPAVLLSAFLAGAFIALASVCSNMGAFNLLDNGDSYSTGRLIMGLLFGSGLLLVIATGAELFTGNMLIIVPVLDRKVTIRRMLLNWSLVYAGNFFGSLCIAVLIYYSGLFAVGGGLHGGVTIRIAAAKTALPFGSAFILGLLCNWLVCLAVWISYGTQDLAGKAAAIFPVIAMFVIAGFEHSIANMYYIPAGLFAKQNTQWLSMAHISTEQLAGLNWINFFTKNLIPVTLGNIAGGTVMVGILYWFILGKMNRTD